VYWQTVLAEYLPHRRFCFRLITPCLIVIATLSGIDELSVFWMGSDVFFFCFVDSLDFGTEFC
jgi:hypothetical protein